MCKHPVAVSIWVRPAELSLQSDAPQQGFGPPFGCRLIFALGAMQTMLPTLDSEILATIKRPLSHVGIRALRAFLGLPHLEGWRPPDLYYQRLSQIFDIGLPLSFLDGNQSGRRHRDELGRAVSRNEATPTSIMSEIHAAAVLTHWGANVQFIPVSKTPTPDLEVVWGSERPLTVEVVRAETKDLHEEVKCGLESFVGALQPGDVEWNLACFVADASKASDLNEMLEAAIRLRCNENAEEPGRWSVKAVPLVLRDEVLGGRTDELHGPSWWPSDEPEYLATATMIGMNKNPVIRIASLVPQTSYLNPIDRKASSGQHKNGCPYLIACEVTNLPRAHERVVHELGNYFKIWPHVSGVLLYELRFWAGVEKKEWVLSLHHNSFSTHPLPQRMSDFEGGKRFSVVSQLLERLD